MSTADSAAEFKSIYPSVYLTVLCLHVHLKSGLTQVWLSLPVSFWSPSLTPSFFLFSFFYFFFFPLSSRPARTDASGPQMTVTASFFPHPYYSCHIMPVSTSPSSLLSVRIHSTSLTLAFTWAPAPSTDPHYQASSSIPDQTNGGLSAWIDPAAPPRKSISPLDITADKLS